MAAGIDAVAARAHLLAEHRETLQRVLDCADAVVAGWDGDATTDREAVTEPLRATLDRAGLLDRFPSLLAAAVRAGGGEVRGQPVAAPPYVAVTSRGPVLRATLAEGRLVVTVGTFEVERAPVRYVRGASTVEGALEVCVR